MINYSRDHSTADALDYVGIWNASMLQPLEMMEAVSANMEKRPGNFNSITERLNRRLNKRHIYMPVYNSKINTASDVIFKEQK